MICLFHRLCKNQQFPHDRFFFDEKETLEESNEHSLINLRWAAHFWFLCSRKQLYIPVFVVLSPIVPHYSNRFDWLERKDFTLVVFIFFLNPRKLLRGVFYTNSDVWAGDALANQVPLNRSSLDLFLLNFFHLTPIPRLTRILVRGKTRDMRKTR